MELKSEFAHVRVELDESGNGPRLMIEDLKEGKIAFFDPLELETLAWITHEELFDFMDPSYSRWRDTSPYDGVDRTLRRLGVTLQP